MGQIDLFENYSYLIEYLILHNRVQKRDTKGTIKNAVNMNIQ